MFGRPANLILRSLCARPFWSCRGFASATETNPTERDPAPYFFDDSVQKTLRYLTRVDYKKVFRQRKLKGKLIPDEYQFMTDEQLKEATNIAMRKANSILQVPPVVKQRSDKTRILSEDYALEGYHDSKIVFTDISLNTKNRDRLIVVRDPSGVLRTADTDERHRMNQVYFSIRGREFEQPKMYETKNLQRLLESKEYEFILDRTCIQYDPDHPAYHEITKGVYEHVLQTRQFDLLRSTRHFGALVFYLVWHNKIDGLLFELLSTNNIQEAVELIKLYYKIHPNAKSANQTYDENNAIEFITNYVNLDASNKTSLKNSLKLYTVIEKEKQNVIEGIKIAHGIQEHDDSSDDRAYDSSSDSSSDSESDSERK